jgi:hypothetical protein
MVQIIGSRDLPNLAWKITINAETPALSPAIHGILYGPSILADGIFRLA